MSGFETYTCDRCSEEFKTLPGSNAAAGTYCSPACESADKGLS
jgi:DNA-directed RNA polymerase subunit RPC12/RpoP